VVPAETNLFTEEKNLFVSAINITKFHAFRALSKKMNHLVANFSHAGTGTEKKILVRNF
jgi:hypothetical protein